MTGTTKRESKDSTNKLLRDWSYFRPTNGVAGVRDLADVDIEELLEIGDSLAERLKHNRSKVEHNPTQAFSIENEIAGSDETEIVRKEATDHLLKEWGYFRPTNGAKGVRDLSDTDIERLLEIGDSIAERVNNNKHKFKHDASQAFMIEGGVW